MHVVDDDVDDDDDDDGASDEAEVNENVDGGFCDDRLRHLDEDQLIAELVRRDTAANANSSTQTTHTTHTTHTTAAAAQQELASEEGEVVGVGAATDGCVSGSNSSSGNSSSSGSSSSAISIELVNL